MLTDAERLKIRAEFDRVWNGGLVAGDAIEAATKNYIAMCGLAAGRAVGEAARTTPPSLILTALLDGYTNFSGGRKNSTLEYFRAELKPQIENMRKWEAACHQRHIDAVRAYITELAA